ncbi:MAG: hypothetical protein CMI01_15050 [Oceanospirillaceae bacterium]|jgi:cell division protein FtsL|nr:hypothetical protein [Oceanospirillaceae bacterium]
MNSQLLYLLIALGIALCAVLVALIRRQLRAQRERLDVQEQQRQKLEREAREHRDYLADSVRIIANAVLHDEKMTITEGCIRLKVLIENLAPHLLQHETFAVIGRVFDATKHIPFLDQWKALSRVEQARYELEMARVEAEHAEDVERAMQALKSYPLEQMQ